MILELKMPQMDGIEVLRWARQVDKAMMVVILTGHGTVEAGLTGLEVGADDFVQKPCDIEVLCDTKKVLGARARSLCHGIARTI
jgi:two-component system NtrC family response regulator